LQVLAESRVMPSSKGIIPLPHQAHRRQDKDRKGMWNVPSDILPPCGGGYRWGERSAVGEGAMPLVNVESLPLI
jgi:hypothetical protein